MASALKRKRGSVEASETPKRAKSYQEAPVKAFEAVAWEAFKDAPTKTAELVQLNGVNGHSSREGSVDFAQYVKANKVARAREKKLKDELAAESALMDSLAKERKWAFQVAEPIGGRVINADPVFAGDEKFLIVANRTTIQVYDTTNSLLVRSIKLQIDPITRPTARIITYSLSPNQPNFLWVACSDGAVYRIDWQTGAGSTEFWGISSTGCIHMAVASMESGGRRRDVVFTTEMRKDGGWRITANELAPPGSSIQTVARTIYTSQQRINYLKTAREGSVIVAASENRVILGALRSTDFNIIDKIKYEFRVFESVDLVSSLDVKTFDRPGVIGKKAVKQTLPIVDVVVGDAKGSIFIHHDLLSNIMGRQDGKPGINLIPRKLHWHRKAVHTVKWSLDGEYIISGGSETVLIIWQLDTGKQQFLPHMAATIQNVVVSPSGTSYAVQLADNSTMVVSVAELKPTANIAGIQASVLIDEDPIESRVSRVQEERREYPLVQRTSAAINPSEPSKLLLGVGTKQEVLHDKSVVTSSPFLETFDLGSGRTVDRQALSRVNITNRNMGPNALPLSEPRITHMKISNDGKWLATVDEWTPPLQDLDFVGHQLMNMEHQRSRRREVFLKFWQWSNEGQNWELVSRIDTPHSLGDEGGAGRVLDLAVDPSSLRFSTIGEDRFVRIWTTKARVRDGVPVRGKEGQALRNWHCRHVIPLGTNAPIDSTKPQQPIPSGSLSFSEDGSLLAAACGSSDQGILHLLDPDVGRIRLTKNRMFAGEIIAIGFLGQDLITLSNRLLVHDLVSDETRYSISLSPSVDSLSVSQRIEMLHLAVDPRSQTFAVALPGQSESVSSEDSRGKSLLSRFSELAVFRQESQAPILTHTFQTLVTALLPSVGTEGYVTLDTAAEIRIIMKAGSQALTELAQSTSALQLDKEPKASESVEIDEELPSDAEMDDAMPVTSAFTEVGDQDDETPVITREQLSEIFDIGPAFALPPMEEMFYRVAGLFSQPVA